jgi:addiction module HigA family antidote
MAKAFKTPGEAVKAQAAAYNLSITQLAEGIKISPSAARLLINNKLRISVSFAQRLSKFFGKTPKYWIDLQTAYELSALSGDKKEASVLKTISKAEKAPVVKKTAKKAPAGKAGARKTAAKKPATKVAAKAKAPAKSAASKKPAAKKTPGRKPAAKAATAKAAAPRAKRTVRKAAPASDFRSAGSDSAPASPWTPSSDN